jgi:hypothetical protein
MRLSDAEREQIAGAAARLSLPLTSFVRQAALQASAVVEKKVSVKAPERKALNMSGGVGLSFSARNGLTTSWRESVCGAAGTSTTAISPVERSLSPCAGRLRGPVRALSFLKR